MPGERNRIAIGGTVYADYTGDDPVFDSVEISGFGDVEEEIKKSDWIKLVTNAEFNGTEVIIASGDVLYYDYESSTIYRFISSTENANGYPSEDIFYSDFDGTNLTNLIVKRGQ